MISNPIEAMIQTSGPEKHWSTPVTTGRSETAEHRRSTTVP
jgi:hypothetical protein